jgi:dUTP pyrophosphatase
MRKIEKISYNQFKKDISSSKKLYESIEIPKRSTKYSAGYDLRSLEDYILKPNESHAFKTGLKVSMNENEVFMIFDRSSVGFKYDVCLSNSVGIIDADYYNNKDNEGHMAVKLINHGTKDYEIKKGDRIAQGIFLNYLCVDDEEEIKDERKGGIGSTNSE